MSTDSFPQQYARTQRLTLGEPRNITVSDDGRKVVFLRSNAGDDPVNRLWLLDVESGHETMVADPLVMLGADDAEDLPPEERARRERLREGAGGITSYSTDAHSARFVCTLSGRLFVGDLHQVNVREIRTVGPVFDPRLSPDGRWVAHVSGRSLRVVSVDGDDEHGSELAGPTLFDEPDTVSWGSAEFVAAEEMNRYRGFWWSPNSRHVAVCRGALSGRRHRRRGRVVARDRRRRGHARRRLMGRRCVPLSHRRGLDRRRESARDRVLARSTHHRHVACLACRRNHRRDRPPHQRQLGRHRPGRSRSHGQRFVGDRRRSRRLEAPDRRWCRGHPWA
jgi:hypothetical protein